VSTATDGEASVLRGASNDTSVFKSYKPEELPSGFLFSAVVLHTVVTVNWSDFEAINTTVT
jgi:hypothetical protein